VGDLAVELGLNASTSPYTDDALGRLKVGNEWIVLFLLSRGAKRFMYAPRLFRQKKGLVGV